MGSFAVAGLQLDLRTEDNLARIAAEVASAKRRFPWIDLIVLPVTLGAYTFAARADAWQSSGIARFRRWIIRVMRNYLEQHLGLGARRKPNGLLSKPYNA
jgi:hypothetical protein